jgi:hypothetical protein
MPQTPDDMLSAVSESLAARTGRSLAQWLALVRSSGVDPLDQAAVRNWLRREHGVPQNSQWAIADAAAREAGWVRPTVRARDRRRDRAPAAGGLRAESLTHAAQWPPGRQVNCSPTPAKEESWSR